MLKKIIIIIILLVLVGVGGFFAIQIFLLPQNTAGMVSPNAIIATEGDDAQFEAALPFEPNPDGFGFRNFSGRFKESNLAIEDVQLMFGDAVCTRVENETCIPNPKVINWIDDMNQIMNTGGHCVGFTVASNQFHTDILTANEYGADITYDLPRELPVLKMISKGFAANYAGSVQTQEVKGTPTEIVKALLELDEPADIGIFFPEYGQNGHSMLAYNVTNQGDGVYHILVYDSNRPGKDNFIVVDTNQDTWFYPDAAINPDLPSGDYLGDAETQSLSFFPLSAYNNTLTCPADFAELCPSAADAAGSSTITVVGRGSALVSTNNGQIGRTGDNLINTIPDGQLVPIRSELYNRKQPIILLPADKSLTVQAQGDQADANLKISVANPTFSVVVDGLVGQPGQIETLSFDPTTQQADFIAGGPQSPTIELVYSQNDAVYSVQLTGITFNAGQHLTVTADTANGNLQMSSDGLAKPDVVLMVARLAPDGEAVFAGTGLVISAGGTQALDLNKWDGAGSLTVLVDDNGDGSYDTDLTLPNEPVSEVLKTIETPDTIIKSMKRIVPYLDNSQTGDVADILPTLGLSGAELGDAYLQLPSLQPDDLTAINLPPAELGPFIVARELGPDETRALLDELNLEPDDKTAVEADIADRQAILNAVDDWQYRNADDPTELTDFLKEKGITGNQESIFVNYVKKELPQQLAVALAPATPTPTPTDTPAPTATNTPVPPTNTVTPKPTATTAPASPTDTPAPTATSTPIPPTSTPAPTSTNTPLPPIDRGQVSDPFAGACSPESDVTNSITFVNQTSSDVATIWVGYDCAEVPYATLAPGESYTQETFTGHPWRARSDATGEFLPLESPSGFVFTYINNNTGGVTVNIRQ